MCSLLTASPPTSRVGGSRPAPPIETAEIQVTFDFPPDRAYDYYSIQWVEAKRGVMVGWHQDETHTELGACHFQLDYQNETVQRERATVLDTHPLNVFDTRMDHLVPILESVTWDDGMPTIPASVLR